MKKYSNFRLPICMAETTEIVINVLAVEKIMQIVTDDEVSDSD